MALMNSKISSSVNAGGFGGAGATGNVTIPSGSFYTYTTGMTNPSYTLNTGAGSIGTAWAPVGSTGLGSTPSIKVTGDAEFEGKITVKGKDLAKSLEAIEKRLAILVPDPKKLDKFEALKKAYDHYKLLEALCHETDDDK